ncbi:MAG: hypothetical protein RAK25_07085, partial [TACK group archaeon]|nr:hypothetical protein [TACK group archaeon]
LILASTETALGKEEYTMMVDGKPRLLRPFGKVESELYDLTSDPKQQINVLNENKEVAKEIKQRFVSELTRLNARQAVIHPWLNCKGLDL